jgi:oligopeptide/dipeptide ABC transporter ATP-binding protein
MGEVALLSVRDLTVEFARRGRGLRSAAGLRAVDSVSFDIQPGQTVGLVGESGSGKSTIARAIAGLVPVRSGSIHFDGLELTRVRRRSAGRVAEHLSMIFQNPFGSLNPRRTVLSTVGAPLRLHRDLQGAELRRAVGALLEEVGLDGRDMDRYPSAFSGGQRQRIAIARAIALRPQLVICDEPLSALDVSIQAQIANLLVQLQDEHGIAYLFISHDLAVVRHLCDEVIVLYLGSIMEVGDSAVYGAPSHPYTQALLAAAPQLDRDEAPAPLETRVIAGDTPSAAALPPGCRFAGRCPRVADLCREQPPPLRETVERRRAACHFPLTGDLPPLADASTKEGSRT